MRGRDGTETVFCVGCCAATVSEVNECLRRRADDFLLCCDDDGHLFNAQTDTDLHQQTKMNPLFHRE